MDIFSSRHWHSPTGRPKQVPFVHIWQSCPESMVNWNRGSMPSVHLVSYQMAYDACPMIWRRRLNQFRRILMMIRLLVMCSAAKFFSASDDSRERERRGAVRWFRNETRRFRPLACVPVLPPGRCWLCHRRDFRQRGLWLPWTGFHLLQLVVSGMERWWRSSASIAKQLYGHKTTKKSRRSNRWMKLNGRRYRERAFLHLLWSVSMIDRSQTSDKMTILRLFSDYGGCDHL